MRNSRLFSPGILHLGPATRSAGQGARPVKPGEHSSRTGVWQEDRGAAGQAGVAERNRILGRRHGAGRTRERRETQGWQGMKETQGKTDAKLEKDTGLAGWEGAERDGGTRQARRGHSVSRTRTWKDTRDRRGARQEQEAPRERGRTAAGPRPALTRHAASLRPD